MLENTLSMPLFTPAIAEIFLAFMGMFLLLLGAFRKKSCCKNVMFNYAILILFSTGIIVLSFPDGKFYDFNNLFVVDGFTTFMKFFILLGATLSLFLSVSHSNYNKAEKFEYPVLILFSTLGMMLMVSANDLMSLYMALELQSLPLYVLAAMQRENSKSSEAGIKYFVLGAISSGMILYGASMIYGFAGTTQFDVLTTQMGSLQGVSLIGLLTGLAFLIAGIAFKVSAAPFHMWTPDVYEGAPTSVTAFFAIVPKIAAFAMLMRLLFDAFAPIMEQWQQIIIFLSAASMILGAVAGIVQNNIKRLMAYSSIGHMGYALMGLAAGGFAGVRGVLIYLSIYMIMTAGGFAVVLLMRRKGHALDKISDLSGVSKNHPFLAFSMAVMMFSMSGIPPLAGFFGKLFIFQSAIASGLYVLAIIGVLSSVVAAFYYLRIVKVMYFDDAEDAFDPIAPEKHIKIVLSLTTALILGFIVMPSPLVDWAQYAASILVAG